MRVPATPAGHDQPRDFVRSRGRIRMIGIEGTGSWGAGLARAPGGRRRADPRGHPPPERPHRRRGEPRTRSEPEPPPAGRRPGADALPVAKTGTGPCEQIRVLPARRRSAMKARARRPPADHRPAGHRPRRRAHPPRTVSAARGLIGALARTRPAPHRPPPPHRRPRGHCAAWPAATGSRADEITDIDTELRAPTARAAPTMLATKALRRQPPPPCSPAPQTTPTESVPRHPSPPCAAPPRSPPAPGRTNRHRLNRGGDRQANWALHQIALVRLSGDPRTKAYAARLTATGKSRKEILRCPRTRHRPRSMAPAGPPPTRTPHRRPAPPAPRTRTHPPPRPPTT